MNLFSNSNTRYLFEEQGTYAKETLFFQNVLRLTPALNSAYLLSRLLKCLDWYTNSCYTKIILRLRTCQKH